MAESEECCCFHCGRKLIITNISGKSRMECPRCGWVMIAKAVKPKHKVVDVYDPS